MINLQTDRVELSVTRFNEIPAGRATPTRRRFCVLLLQVSCLAATCFGGPNRALHAADMELKAPRSVPRFAPAEFTVRIKRPQFKNPFTEVDYYGIFSHDSEPAVRVSGFADSRDGSLYRLRFAPMIAGVEYQYMLRIEGGGIGRSFRGQLRCEPSDQAGQVIVDPEHKKHFVHAGSRRPFYHVGYTAYHLLDPSNDDAQVRATIDYCARLGFNKIRFLLTGYPRDTDNRTSGDVEHGVPDPWKAPNYGATPGRVNALPAWLGTPHHYDFTRFNVPYWQRVDRAVRYMRERAIVADCIITIEKQGLPREYGRLTAAEYQLYRYSIARLAAFDNVWWDLGNEHNEYRDAAWGNRMGEFVKKIDPYNRLASAHAYADFFYSKSPWADYIITQQYGSAQEVHDWALKYASTPKPYVNEEYGYEGSRAKPGHGQNTVLTRTCHWAIAMAGGYATYGDWSGGVSYFYMGTPGPGKFAHQVRYLRKFFEALPYRQLVSSDRLCVGGFCLAAPPDCYVFYFPRGGTYQVDLSAAAEPELAARWFNTRTGAWQDGPKVRAKKITVKTPDSGDWALLIKRG